MSGHRATTRRVYRERRTDPERRQATLDPLVPARGLGPGVCTCRGAIVLTGPKDAHTHTHDHLDHLWPTLITFGAPSPRPVRHPAERWASFLTSVEAMALGDDREACGGMLPAET